MTKPVSNKQMEQIARRMGYTGPMSKFGEFLMSSPKRSYAKGGLVEKPEEIPLAPVASGSSGTSTFNTSSSVPTPNLEGYPGMPTVEVEKLTSKDGQFIPNSSGQIKGPVPKTPVATGTTDKASLPDEVKANTYKATLTSDDVENVVNQFQYATGTVEEDSTVRGQLGQLMQDFEGGETPAWAAGALRSADAQALARGLGSSSMAGAARVQAAMESALPIAMQDASAHLQMQFQNLNNEQQALMLANQTRTQALFTDAAAENAAKQFNATSKNQTDQFNESLRTSVETFNTEQVNAMRQFNAGQKNAMTQFRASLKQDRAKFNATNQLIVDQANAKWRQEIATINNANVNEANRQNAQMLAEKTLTEMNAYFQERRDVMNYSYQAAQNDADRATELLMAQMSLDEVEKQTDSAANTALWETIGAVTAEFFR